MNPLHDALLGRHAGSDRPFLHLPGGGTVTYDAFAARAARVAGALSALGLGPGDRLALQVAKSADALVLTAACIRAGVAFVPLNPAHTDAEVGYFLRDSGARVLVCDPDRAEGLRRALAGPAPTIETMGADGAGTLADRAAAAADAPVADRAGSDLAALLYTSGTTGRAKGAMLTQDNLASNASALTEAWRFTRADVLLHALPIFHVHGLFVAVNVVMAAGASMLLLPRFAPDAVMAALPRATAMMGVPTFYTRLLADPRLDAAAVAHMRLFVSGSAPLLARTHRAWAARTGHAILERYGMTETGMIASNPYDGARRPGTVGFPLPGVAVRVADEAGVPVPPGEVGGIEVAGPNVFAGYWGMPERTAAEMRADGYFATGDLGRIDAEGYLRIVGRAKDLVISGGFNVYPREVETVLDAQPGVAESAVIGVPHPDLGEAAVAVLVPAGDRGDGPDLEAVRAAVADALARYKHPRAYLLADALPRNAMGKVQKAELRAAHAGLFA